jgi:uncharacterized membrane protein
VLKALQGYFLTGLLAITPLVITIWVLLQLYQLIDRIMRPWLQRIPGLTETYPDFALTTIAFLSFVLIIVIIGLGTRSLVGRAFMNLIEAIIHRIPFVKTIFMATKQIASVFLTDKRSAFQKVVLFEYPRRHCYSIGFVTHDDPEHTMLNIFLPTTPNPTSGYMLLIPREQTVILPLSVEDGIKLIISGGSIMTPEQAAPLREAAATLHAGRSPGEISP